MVSVLMGDSYGAHDVLLRHGALERVALVEGRRRITYKELLAECFNYAEMLRRSGVRKGDRVCIFLRRSAEAVATLFATWLAGAVAVVMNEQLRARQVQHILENSEAACLVTDSTQLSYAAPPPAWPFRVIDLDVSRPPVSEPSAERVIGTDLAALIYTSGSTGLPKGVMVSHDNLRSGAKIVGDYLHLSDEDVTLSVLPLSFDYGLNQVLSTFAAGGTLVIQRSLFPSDICDTMQSEGVTGLAGVPMFWQQLTSELSPFLTCPLPQLRYITNSGGKLPAETVGVIRSAHPRTQIYLMYGLTEAFRSTYLPPDDVDQRPSSIGKAIPNVEVLVVSATGSRCRPGEIGELVHRGANVSLGYWRDPQATGRVFRPHPFQYFLNGKEEVVVFSGDLVTADDEGYLYFIGRKDQQIKSRGIRVSPEEVETWITSSGLVTSAVAFAVPSQDDDDICVVVIPSEPSTFRAEALDEFCRRELPDYMRPRSIWTVKEFPQTTTGKADRLKIRDMFYEPPRTGRSPRSTT